MKMTDEHYDQLVRQLRTKAYLIAGHRRRLRSTTMLGSVEKRLRWDLMWAVQGISSWVCDELYKYLDDTHIDTALRAALIELEAEL